MNNIDTFPNRKIIVDGKANLYFGGTAYLGLQTDEKFQNLFIKNIKKYGTNYGASRNANVQISIYKKAEDYLAGLVESESCLTVSSGYLAAQLVTSLFDNNTIFFAPNTHVALHQKGCFNFPSYGELNKAILKHLRTKKTVPTVCIDSIDFFGNNYPLFHELKKLPLEKIILVADDSHGIGLPLNKGKGCYSLLKQLNPKELIVCASLGKGFAVQAGAVFASKKRIDNLRRKALYGGASPATPASLATIISAKNIYQKKQGKLKHHIEYFSSNCTNLSGYGHMPLHPAFSFTDNKIKTHLEKNNIIITSFNYPKKESPAMNKIILSAYHKKKDVDLLVKLINTLS